MPDVFVIGGSGQIGMAVAARLSAAGWSVRLGSRQAPPAAGPWRHVAMAADELEAALGAGADLVLDCIAFDGADADRLISVGDRVGRVVAVSSASVYRDAAGRTLDEASETGFPQFPLPIPVEHATVAPGPETYSTRKVEMEKRLLAGLPGRATILRPCAIHGAWSKHAREWWFVKRLLDGRRAIPLAYGGRSRFQTTSVAAIAEAVERAAADGSPEVVNVADADAPDVAEIGRAIMAEMGVTAELVGLPDAPFPPDLGVTPWSVAQPMIVDAPATEAGPYAQSVGPAVRWLMEDVARGDWRAMVPQLAAYPRDHFDYGADDRALAEGGAI
ncbi:MAG: NAD-dependent epimerase/dehydratase family protein [Pseudomonadota bacterium]